MPITTITKNSASFRDPDGFVFESKGLIFRAIHENYVHTFNECLSNGFFETLIKERLLLPFTRVDDSVFHIPNHPIVIKPTQIKFLTYPYEWSVGQLTDAARCTLRIQELSISYGYHLKDATPFNIQFVDGKPTFIDTLSFYRPQDVAWGAYKQFCECFYGPLLLMTQIEKDLVRIMEIYPNGLPLKIASKMLPRRSWLNSNILFHIHLHAKGQIEHHNGKVSRKGHSSLKVDKNQNIRLVESLQHAIGSLIKGKSIYNWVDYYHHSKIDQEYLASKIEIVSSILSSVKPEETVDIGTNTGLFAKIASKYSKNVIALDRDSVSVNRLYNELNTESIGNIIPLVMDILNPSPPLGWMNMERNSFYKRIQPDMVMLLGISHHFLAQANINFTKLLELCSITRKYLILEYIPDDDPNYVNMFESREKDFDWYTQEDLLKILQKAFAVIDVKKVTPTNRCIIFAKKLSE